MSSSAVQKNTTVVQAAASATPPPKRSWADVARAASVPAPSAVECPATLPTASEGDASAIAAAGKPHDKAGEADVQSEAEAQPEDEPLDDEAADEAEPELESFDSQPQATVRPGPRGSHRSLCHGEVLVVLGHYGWLAVQCRIDHPDAGKYQGRIYFRRCDVKGHAELVPGDAVDYYLYADDQGLGAEEVRLRGTGLAGSRRDVDVGLKAWGMRTSAPSFAPGLSAAAAEFVPAPVPAFEKHFALAFVPIAHAKKAMASPPATGLNCFAFNAALLSDDSDSEEEGSTAAGGSSDRNLGASSDSENEAGTPVGWGRRGTGAGAGVSLSWDAPPGLPVPKGVVLTGFRPAPGLSLL